MKPAYAQNAAIIKDDGNVVTYSGRCPSCGYVETGKSAAAVSSRTNVGMRSCSKCKTKYEIRLMRG